jgi:hypothetical protein
MSGRVSISGAAVHTRLTCFFRNFAQ